MPLSNLPYSHFLETIPDAAMVVDGAGRIVLANSQAHVMFGYEPGALQALSIHTLIPDTEAEPMLGFFVNQRTRPLGAGQILLARRKDGSEFSTDLMLKPIALNEDRLTVCVVRDITKRRQAELLRTALLEIMQGLAVTDDLQAFLRLVHTSVAKVIYAENFFVTLYNTSTDLFEEVYSVDQFDPPAPPSRLEKSVSAYVFRTGQPLLLTLSRFEELVAQGEVALVGTNSPSWLGVPLKTPRGTVGVMVVQDYERSDRYSEVDIEFLASIASQVASAIVRKQVEQQVQRQLAQLAALRAIDQAISGSLDLQMTLDIFLEQVIRQLNVDAADVLLLNQSDQTLSYTAGHGFRSSTFQHARLRRGEGRAGRAAAERRIVTETGTHLAPTSARTGFLMQEDFGSYYGVPLIAKGNVLGVLELFHRAPLQPDAQWLRFLEVLAGQAAIAIENAQLFAGLQRSNQDLLLAYDTTIEGWSRALDLRDRETEGHTQRVTELAERLARAMGIGETALVHIRRGALLHDIGKMGVPDRILLKPAKLTDEEWAIMRQHPQFAFELLAPIAFLRPALDIPGCHHEKWDGTGYPRGLKGEQIPLAARLFAVVDVWDALTSDRPYRKAWPEDAALAYLREQAGKHFDPQAVGLFLRVMNRDGQA
jgi:PAS domain S-box-containing protein/putative nucleotidyltransferase with HDIG domain